MNGACSILFLVGFIKDLGFRRIILRCDNEPSTKSLQDAVIQSCAGVEVIPQGPLEGDHMANSRVEMSVREVKRQCSTLRIFCLTKHKCTHRRSQSVTQLVSWFHSACHEQNANRLGWKDERNVTTCNYNSVDLNY